MNDLRCVGLAFIAATAVLILPGATVASQGGVSHERALVFFNSLCITCRADASKIRAWSERERGRYTLSGVGFMMSDSESRSFAEGLGWRFPVEGDPNGRTAASYHVTVPTEIVIIDGRHRTLISYARWGGA
jgi:hypothetical protein